MIVIHNTSDFEAMAKAGSLTAEVLRLIADRIKPGVTTNELDKFVHEFALDHGAIPAPLNYKGFPKSICTSINHAVCHGIPSERKLKDGDIVKVDVTLIVEGWHGDSCKTFPVGDVSVKAKRLIEVAHDSMWAGVNAVKPGATLKDIAAAIQKVVEDSKCSVVREYGGHGIGREFHAEPHIFNYVDPKYTDRQNWVLKPGMFFTIEPMVNLGKPDTKLLKDGWTVVTRDRSLSAMFEHTVGVTETGCQVFTDDRQV